MKVAPSLSRSLLFRLGLVIVVLALSVPVVAQPSPAFTKALDKGQALMKEGKFEPAIKHLKKAERLAGEPPVRLLLDIAACSNNAGRASDAEAYARRALKLATESPDQARAYNYLGISLYSQAVTYFRMLKTPGRDLSKILEETEEAFRQVLKITDGQATVAWYNLAEALKMRGQRQEASSAFAEYLERAPDGTYAAGARRAIDWLACVQEVYGPKSPSDGSSETAANAPVSAGGDVMPPVKIRSPAPQYTQEARQQRVEGMISFEAIIDKNGDVRCLDLIQGLPLGLSESAFRTVKQWKFEPATRDGEPMVVKYNVTINMRVQ